MDFNSSTAEILLNPRIDPAKRAKILSLLDKVIAQFSGHIIIASSGTTKTDHDDFKLVALSKNAILTSAASVNKHLNATSNDIWLNPLPEFHVGGLGILARAFLTNSKVIQMDSWEPKAFTELITSHHITFTSLVPAQVYDLCLLNIKCPSSLKALIVGGGAMNQELYEKAKSLGWPLLVSYGMTEIASQIATSTHNSLNLCLLTHVKAKINSNGLLMLKSPSLLTAYILISEDEITISDPKSDGWLTTEDLCRIEDKTLTILGRANDFIKIGGEGVLFSHLEKRFEEIKLKCNLTKDAAIIAYPDERLGFVVHLASTFADTSELIEMFNSSVMPYERIRHTHHMTQIPRTALKKILKAELMQSLLRK